MQSEGITVNTLTDAQRKDFIRATQPVYDKWVPKIGRDIYENAQEDMGR